MLRSLAKDLLRSLSAERAPESPAKSGRPPPKHKYITVPAQLPSVPAEMLIGASEGLRLAEAVTLIVPSVASRSELLRSTLAHFARFGLKARIVISDHSAADQRDSLRDVVANYGSLDITVEYHDPGLHFLDRLRLCAETAESRYVVVHADDDLMLPAALIRCADFLDAHADHAACQGRSFFVKLVSPDSCKPTVNRCLSRQEASTGARIVAHCSAFTPTLYALTRRDAFIAASRDTLDYTENVIFWQYLNSCFLLRHGQLRTLDELYYLRLFNPRGWRESLVQERDRTHWPYLVVSPGFSSELERFKQGLRSAMSSESSSSLPNLVDDACLDLIRRAFGLPQQNDANELKLFDRLFDPTTPERATVAYFAAAAAAALARQVPSPP